MQDVVRVAAIPFHSQPGETEANLARLSTEARAAAAAGAHLALLPELSLTGFIPNHPTGDHNAWLRQALAAARAAAQPIPGPATDALARIASETGLYLAAGLLEDTGNVLHNTHVLVGPEGLLGAWRKLHVPMFEMPFYNGGTALPVVATPLGRIGINICFDALIPESTRLLAVQNAEIVLFPFAADPAPGTPEAWAAWAQPALQARCVENGIFGIAANYLGHVQCAGAEQSFPGGAAVFGPRGNLIAGPTAGTLVAELRRDELLSARAEPEALFRFRRPEIYGPLTRL
ncbi:MAG: carbon-nitrogen hydrolase family protein [Acidobacteria bacterium]|nr:carbon-nitrogen hydrolase family protein [Acidobacteriota bacterium]